MNERLRAEVAQRVHGMMRALGDEIRAMQACTAHPIELRNGVRLGDSEGGSLYSFRLDRELTVPSDTEVAVSAPGIGAVEGTLVASHDFDLVLHLRASEDIRSARLVLTPWKINHRLRKRLKEPPGPAGLERAAQLLNLAPVGEEDGSQATRPANLNSDQLAAVARCVRSPLHFVWGPPGTGKTVTLAATVRALVERGERVLVASHANVAVDVAMLRVAEAFDHAPALAEGRILRFGPVHHEEARKRDDILVENPAARELGLRRRALEARRRALAARLRGVRDPCVLDELEAIRSELGAVDHALEEAQTRLLGEARVLGTTLARAVVNDAVYNWPFDAVVVDEAGAAPFPSVFALAARGPKRLLLFGDFRQLAPVSMADTPFARQWVHRDAFAIAGVTARCDARMDEPRLTMLRTQHRMPSCIAEAVSVLAYDGRLLTAPRANDPTAVGPPWPGRVLTIVDTSSLEPAACRDAESRSRLNPLHAALALDLYRAFNGPVPGGGPGVGLVTPYRAQARLMSGALERPSDAATVHRFQGSERDVMIVDLVDAPSLSGPSHLTGRDPETARRLLNVALSRARGRVVVVAHVPFVLRTHPPTSPVRQFLESQAHEVVPAIPPWTPCWREAQDPLADDLSGAEEAVVHLPPGFAASGRLLAALREVASLTLFADPQVAVLLEDVEDADLRLMHPAGGLFAVVDNRVAHVGGQVPRSPVARIDRAGFASALRELLLGRSVAWGLRRAAVESALRKVAGRCPSCGEERRPRQGAAGWVLQCRNGAHPAVPVDRNTLEPVAEELICPECKMPGIAMGETPELWIECQGDCGGRMPSLEELLGGAPDWRP